ncbi:MAG TPA: aminotransferase class V-fold PLP-dependent enzyme [Pirellulales bacterium]|jgi:cysteine desulfurase family protein|nr:aminotransferase class V-fold PLP-dependent enzyme [Pirellulales bacterium]
MPTARRIYFDNAATSWPKPETVYQAVDDYQRRLGAPAGRSAYRDAAEVELAVAAARSAVARLIGAEEPARIIFTQNGTQGLNFAIHGLLRPGDHVVTTIAEHNSVLRPLRDLENDGQISVSRVPVDGAGIVDPDEIRAALTAATRLIALTAASNVTGAVQPIEAVGRLAREAKVRFLVDAAQAVGHWPLAVKEVHADLVAAPGHKGLLGPLGTGFLYLAPGIEQELRSIQQGGTGSRSDQDVQPAEMPDKYESGNLNVPGLIGLRAGVEYVLERTVEVLRQEEQTLTAELLAGLHDTAAVKIYGPTDPAARVGVVSLTFADFDPQVLAALLDSTYQIQTRAGLHCAPLMHQALGTLAQGGTLRLSLGPFNQIEEVRQFLGALNELAMS